LSYTKSMVKVKKFTLSILIGLAGLLLVLSGFNLVQLSGTLSLYIGVMLLAVAGMMYMLP